MQETENLSINNNAHRTEYSRDDCTKYAHLVDVDRIGASEEFVLSGSTHCDAPFATQKQPHQEAYK